MMFSRCCSLKTANAIGKLFALMTKTYENLIKDHWLNFFNYYECHKNKYLTDFVLTTFISESIIL